MFEVLGKITLSLDWIYLIANISFVFVCFTIHACLFRNTQVKCKIIANVKQFLCLVLELFIIEVYRLFF